MPNTLPEFDRPPLDEVAIGVQFETLKGFHAAHLGLFWSRVRDKYPLTEDQPPLGPMADPGEASPDNVQEVVFGKFPLIPRIWFLDQSKHHLLQVQPDRFHRNWRQLEDNEPYPRYEHLIREFGREWDEFTAFLKDEKIEAPTVNRCEIVYINNLPAGVGWEDASDLGSVFTPLRDLKKSEWLPAPELFSWSARYKLPEGHGRLMVKMQPAFRNRDLHFVLVFDLTARGAPASNTRESILAWFDNAHEAIVRAFDELTQAEMHKTWGKKS